MKVKITHIIILLLIVLSGCGIFKSSTKMDSSTDSTAVKNETVNLAEYESLDANIPASFIKSITTPSGMKIELRDSVLKDTGSGESTASENTDDSGIDESHSYKPKKLKELEPGFISLSFETEKEQRDSTVTKTKKEEQKSEVKETEVETNWSWLTWLFIGIAVALALIVAALIFLK